MEGGWDRGVGYLVVSLMATRDGSFNVFMALAKSLHTLQDKQEE